MPNQQRHRGAHPSDANLFAAKNLPAIRDALRDLTWLLSRGYSDTAALKLVGDHRSLCKRQRKALQRASSSVEQRAARAEKRISSREMAGQHVAVDGFNCIITFEAMLSGGPIFIGNDGAMRDLASVHGSYRRVEETASAIGELAQVLVKASKVTWLLDRPVSNSGRLAAQLRERASQHDLPWDVELVNSPDDELAKMHDAIIATSDCWILDQSSRWVQLGEHFTPPALWLIDLR